MVRVDITCDLIDEDETGHVWAFLRDTGDQAFIQPGAFVVAGDEDAPAVAAQPSARAARRRTRWRS